MPSTSKVCLQVLPALVTGGVERGTIDVAQALAAAGWTALVASSGGPMTRELERVGARHIALPLKTKNPLALRRNARRIAEVVKSNHVSLIHARSRAPAWSARAAAREMGIPFVTTFHGVYDLGPFGVKKFYNRVMAAGDRVIAISEFIRDHLMREYDVAVERIRLIHRGVDLTQFDPARVAPVRLIQLAQKWRLMDSLPTIILPGRLSGWKGHRLLIEALAVMKSRGLAQLRCMMVGQGETPGTAAALESHAESHGVGGWVQIVEDCNDLPAAYMVSDVVVSASTRPEAFGRVVAEGQALGRPVVAPAHGAAQEIIEPGVTGWLFTPGDAVSLADAIERALKLTREERERIASRAIERVRAKFDKADMCAKTIAVYDEVLAVKPPT